MSSKGWHWALGRVLVEEQEGEEGLVYKMPLSVKGKRMFNILLKAYGKEKGETYSMLLKINIQTG